MSRVKYASKNIKYGYLGNILTLILKFLSRTVFVYTIGVTYLGVNGLYVNILSVLSFADLGIGSAMNYSLYKPVAENDTEKIKSLMHLYKYLYHWISLIITLLGLCLLPFLDSIIKDSGLITSKELIIYYLIFLFNTVSSYFVAYKYSLVNAEQKNYIQTNIQTITMAITTVIQMLVLIFLKSFLFYLLSTSIIELLQKFFSNRYINKKYPFLLDKAAKKLTKVEKDPIVKNIKALILHKIGDVSVYQTDNILISLFINIKTVGLVSNYLLIISAITSFINIIFNSLISSFGNLIATENTDKQFELFKVYRFVGFWFYGFSSIAIVVLINPFIEIWIGDQMIIGSFVVHLIIIDYYLKGQRILVNNFKIAAGIFSEDKYLGLIQAIVNLAVSIIMVKEIGLPGIYVGTIVQGLISNLSRPFIVYRKVFSRSGIEYFADSLFYFAALLVPLLILHILKPLIIKELTISSFLIMSITVVLTTNIFFYILLKGRKEFKYLVEVFMFRIKEGS